MDIKQTIFNYVNGSSTPEEMDLLLQWLQESTHNQQEFREIYDIWLSSRPSLSDNADIEEALAKLKRRIRFSSEAQNTHSKPARRLIRIAVVAVMLPLFALGGYLLRDLGSVPNVVMNRAITSAGSKAQFTLPDGSIVWLNANSTLEYPEIFVGKHRTVRLKGEAMFDVTENRALPFIVQADEMEIEVLGTRFAVQNYENNPAVETVLVEGSVKIDGEGLSSPHILVPGQLLCYNKTTAQTDIKMVDSSNYTDWTNSRLVFDNIALSDIIFNLQKWYGVEIVASANISSTRMSFTVRDEPLEEIIRYLALTLPASYRWDDGKLYLSPSN
jgi:ferric-dicitrate binding protein FerR (iron transport regulator)